MKLEEVGELFDKIVDYYPVFGVSADEGRIKSWHQVLKDVPLSTALKNLERYAADPRNEYAPHPGALAIDIEIDLYHERMKNLGNQVLYEYDQLNPAPPTEEQKRKVREILAKQRYR